MIVAVTNPTALAIRAATGTIPIVWIGADAIRFGLVTNLAHPGGNITGVSRYDLEFYGKFLQILKEVVPSATRLGWLTPRRTMKNARSIKARSRMERSHSSSCPSSRRS